MRTDYLLTRNFLFYSMQTIYLLIRKHVFIECYSPTF